jgi:uncharacterized Zn-binding protein involved in type VI secretion
MALPASRQFGSTACPSHGCGNICIGAPTVHVNSRPQVRGGDRVICRCASGDFVVTGSGTVIVNGKPAVRLSDVTFHAGSVIDGAPNVVIGGPRVGAGIVDDEAIKSCEKDATSRHRPGLQQSYENCGLESIRAIINRDRRARGLPTITEDEFLREAIAQGITPGSLDGPFAGLGGTTSIARQKLLDRYGVATHFEAPTLDNIVQAVGSKRGVVVSLDPSFYWPTGAAPRGAGHAVCVVGVVFDANGRPMGYVINDTGSGVCGLVVPLQFLDRGLYPGGIAVTDAPIGTPR